MNVYIGGEITYDTWVHSKTALIHGLDLSQEFPNHDKKTVSDSSTLQTEF